MRIVKSLFALACMCMVVPLAVNARMEKKEKEKKEKKAYEWNWDKKLSGNKTVDGYLLSVDSLWYQVKEVNDLTANYTFKVDTFKVEDDYYALAYMLDASGNYITRATVNWQFASVSLLSASVLSKGALAGVQSAAALTALPGLGLKAISFGKYVKAGPVVVANSVKGVKNIWGISVAQAKRWNAMKKAAIKVPESIGYPFTAAQKVKLNKCCYLTKIDITTPEGQALKEVMEKKSQEQLANEQTQCFNSLENTAITPEDRSKITDDLDESLLDQFSQEV